jgi:hypothetical protein
VTNSVFGSGPFGSTRNPMKQFCISPSSVAPRSPFRGIGLNLLAGELS